MALTAGQINPAYYPQPNYSGVVQSAQMQAREMANIGASIGGAIKDFGEENKLRKKEQAEQNKQVKLAESVGKLIVQTMPEYADMINPSLAILGDQNIPLDDRAFEALTINEGFKTRLNLEGLKREREMDALRMQNLRAGGGSAANASGARGLFLNTTQNQ